MKFSTKQQNILPALQLISGVAEKKQTLPILSHILLELDKDTLSLSGTDLELELEIKIKVENSESGKATVSARKALDIVRSLNPADDINFELKDETRLLVNSGKSRFSLGSLTAEDFPKTEVSNINTEFTIAAPKINTLLEKTMFSMALQDVRYYLNGVLLETESKSINVVATDGHRLAIDSLTQDVDFKEKNQVIIPRKTVIELTRVLSGIDDEVTIGFGQNHIYLKTGDSTLLSKLIDGRYPDYQRVIPHDVDKTAIFNKEKLKNSLMRAAILSNEKYRGIRMNFSSGTVGVSANNPEQEEAHDEIDVNYAGEDIEIGFNVTYLIEAISAIKSDNLRFMFKDASSSCIIQNEEEDYPIYVVMPMRL